MQLNTWFNKESANNQANANVKIGEKLSKRIL